MRDKIGQPLEIGDVVLTYIPDYYVLSEPNIVIAVTKKKIRLGIGRLLRDPSQCVVITEQYKSANPSGFAEMYQRFSKVLNYYSVDEERLRITNMQNIIQRPTHTRYLCILRNPDYIYMYKPCDDVEFDIDVYELSGSEYQMKQLINAIRRSYSMPYVQLKAKKAYNRISGDSRFKHPVTQQRQKTIQLFSYPHTVNTIEILDKEITVYRFREKPYSFYQ